jgi:hypothetical protein
MTSNKYVKTYYNITHMKQQQNEFTKPVQTGNYLLSLHPKTTSVFTCLRTHDPNVENTIFLDVMACSWIEIYWISSKI